MDQIEILVLNGSPGSGKTATANAISDLLIEDNIPHAVIDFDELGRIYPESNHVISWQNLTSVCANYSKISNLNKLIIPVAIDSEEILNQLKQCASGAKWIICELFADRETLLKRVAEREPNEYWREKLRTLVNNYADRSEDTKFGEIKIKTDSMSIDEVAKEVIKEVGWNKS